MRIQNKLLKVLSIMLVLAFFFSATALTQTAAEEKDKPTIDDVIAILQYLAEEYSKEVVYYWWIEYPVTIDDAIFLLQLIAYDRSFPAFLPNSESDDLIESSILDITDSSVQEEDSSIPDDLSSVYVESEPDNIELLTGKRIFQFDTDEADKLNFHAVYGQKAYAGESNTIYLSRSHQEFSFIFKNGFWDGWGRSLDEADKYSHANIILSLERNSGSYQPKITAVYKKGTELCVEVTTQELGLITCDMANWVFMLYVNNVDLENITKISYLDKWVPRNPSFYFE